MNLKEFTEKYSKHLNVAKDLFVEKLKEYGASYLLFRPESLTDQVANKAHRIVNIQKKNGMQKVYTPEDTIYLEYVGIINYSLIALSPKVNLSNINKLSDSDIAEIIYAYDFAASECFDLLMNKNDDYGNSWRFMRATSYIDMILVKLNRIKRLEDIGQSEEKIRDNYLDIVNYAMFALIKNPAG